MNRLNLSLSARPRVAQTCARCRSAVVVVAALSVLVGCGSDDPGGSGGKPESPTSTAPTSTPTAAAELEGSWRAGPISPEDSEATLRRHGLARYVEDYRKTAPFSGDTVLTLTIEDGAWDLYGESGGGQPEPIDYDAEYQIDGETVVFHHSDGSNTFRWSVDGDTLTLEFMDSTLPEYKGIPEEVFQRALYMTAAFTRRS